MILKNISIRNLVVLLFIALTVTSGAIVGYSVFSGWLAFANDNADRLAAGLNERILGEIEDHLNIPLHIVNVYKDQIENGSIDLQNEARREKFFASVLMTHGDELYSFSYGSEEGEYYGARRNPDKKIEIMKNNRSTGGVSWYYSLDDDFTSGELALKAGRFDPRTRDWYRAARESGKTVFSPVYRHFVMADLAVSAAAPVLGRNGKLLGVLGAHITLSKLNSGLGKIAGREGGIAAVVEKDSGTLIGNSFGQENFELLPDGTFRRLTLAEGKEPVLRQAAERYEAGKNHAVKVTGETDSFLVYIHEFRREGIDWLVFSALPERIFMAGVYRNMASALALVLLVIFTAALICAKVSAQLMNPLENLVLTAESISAGDLSRRAGVVRNDEIGRVARALNLMAGRLQSLISSLEEMVRERTAELEERNRELDHSRDHLQLILDSAAEGIFGIDRGGNCTFANASCLKMLGYGSQEDVKGKNMHLMIHYAHGSGSHMDLSECPILETCRTGKGIHVDRDVFWKSDGTSLEAAYSSYPQFRDGELIGAVVTFTDNSERRKNEERIHFLTCHDSLTGLFNRAFFEEELRKMDRKDALPLTIIFGDVNGLKLTNDIFGHSAGDELLKMAAEALKKSCREEDIISRVGGDEFTVILPRTTPEDAKKVIGRIRGEFSKIRVGAIRISLAAGFATKSEPEEPVQETLREAEEFMYRDKSLSRKTVNDEMIGTIMETLHERSPREKRHSESMSRICTEIGRAMKMPETEIRKLKEAGFLHDIGKIVIEEDILNEPGDTPLREEERSREMRKHPVAGYRILNLFDETMDLGEGILNHHENWDGSGYPRGIGGEEIPLTARILRAGDVFDRILESVGDGTGTWEEGAADIRKQRGTVIDPQIADILIAMIRERQG